MKRILVALLLLSLCYPAVALSASISRDKPDNTSVKSAVQGHPAHTGYVQKGAFAYWKNADRFSRRLRKRGYRVLLVKGTSSRGTKVYRVLARKMAGMPAGRPSRFHKTNELKPAVGLRATAARHKVIRDQKPVNDVAGKQPRFYKAAAKTESVGDSATGGRTSSPDVAPAERVGVPNSVSLASAGGDEGVPEGAKQEEAPVGTLKTYSEIYTNRKRYFHASLSVDEIYTDNAFQTQNNKKSNLSTVITPAIWFVLPRVTEEPVLIEQTSNRMPGGLVVSRYSPENRRRLQFHFIYKPTIPLPSSNSPYGNAISHNAYGDLEYNGNKISGLLSDTFVKSYDTLGQSISTQPGQINRFYSNRTGAAARIDAGNRLRVSFDYANFIVHYSDQGSSFMNRTDNSYSGSLYYKLQPKTSAFVEYTLIDISYDGDSTRDGKEHHFMAGLQWDITAKSQGMIQAGYDKKDFNNFPSSANALIAEAQIRHQFTPKTSVTLTGFRKTDESNAVTYLYAITDQLDVGVQHILTPKITGMVDALYAHERYKGALTSEGNTSDLENNIYQGRLAIQYEFQRWLRSSLGYVYTKRDSNFPEYNFSSNTFDFQVTGAF